MTDSIIRIERELAIEGAQKRIMDLGELSLYNTWPRAPWFVGPRYERQAELYEAYSAAVRYLDLRGLIERHQDHPDWVRIKTEETA